MALFQTPPRDNEEAAKYEPLDIGPEQVLEMSEEEWYEQIYRGADVPQLTVRAILMGSVLGFLLAFTNLYIGLKTGWALGVAITACILSHAIWTMMVRSGAAKSNMTILETNCMQSTASSAGYSTGGTMVSAIAAMLLLSATPDNREGTHLDPWVLTGWTLALAALGTVMAIPMKRNLINRDRLKFPSGTAAAVTLQSLFSRGDVAIAKAKALAWSAGFGGLLALLLDFQLVIKDKIIDPAKGTVVYIRDSVLPGHLDIFDKWLPAPGGQRVDGKWEAFRPSNWTMTYDVNPVMIAAGGLVGLRIGFYMVIGGLILVYGLGTPAMEHEWTSPYGVALEKVLDETAGVRDIAGYSAALEPVMAQFAGYATDLRELIAESPSSGTLRVALLGLAESETKAAVTNPSSAWREVGLWFGVSIMVAYGILSFLTQWRTILRSFSGLANKNGGSDSALVKETEVPISWFAIGTAVSGIAAILLAYFAFEIPVVYGFIAVALTFLLSMVAARATGESDITPVGAMGKIMQLTFGSALPQSATANLMSASITANAAGSAADLLNDLKSGYLLGANPRRQFIAQMWGIVAGTIATVWGFYILVPDATVMTGVMPDGTINPDPKYPAPAAQAWWAIAKVMTGGGLEAMHPMHRTMVYWGLGLGTAMLVLEMLLPKCRGWLPSATGLGLGLILPFQYPLSMLIGAIIAAVWSKSRPKSAEKYLVPIISGLIAGIAIMGVIGALVNSVLLNDEPKPIVLTG